MAARVRRTDERSAILAVLREADEPMSPTDIGQPRNNIKQLLFKMTKAGEVLKLSGRGRYVHPTRMDLDNRHHIDNFDNQITN